LLVHTQTGIQVFVEDGSHNNDVGLFVNTGIISTNTWYHIAAVYNGSSWTVYRDGIDITSSLSSGNGTANTAGVLRMGKRDADRYFTGLIDGVRIYDYIRTPAQIAWDYNRGAPTAHWKMDEGQDSATTCDATDAIVYDSQGSNDGTLDLGSSGNTDTTAAWSEGKYSCAIDFDGTDDAVQLSSDPFTGFVEDFTLSAWIYPDAITTYDHIFHIYSANKGVGIRFPSPSTELGLIMGDHSKTGINTMFNTGTIVGSFCNIFGRGFPPKYIPSFTWGGAGSYEKYDLNKALSTAKIVMSRRNFELSEELECLISRLHENTAEERASFNK